MGACRVPKYAMYSHDKNGSPINIDYPYAFVIVVAKEMNTIRASTGHDFIGDPVSFQGYERVILIAQTIANYMRRLGYHAMPQHPPIAADKYQSMMPPLLLWSGIGKISRAGIVLNPFLGLSFKCGAILTDMPLVPDKPIDFGLQDFCQHCHICADMCPSQAIPKGDKVVRITATKPGSSPRASVSATTSSIRSARSATGASKSARGRSRTPGRTTSCARPSWARGWRGASP